MSDKKRPGEHTEVKEEGKVIGWIIERLPITMGADKYPFMAGVPSEYYGFKIRTFGSFTEGEIWIKEQSGLQPKEKW